MAKMVSSLAAEAFESKTHRNVFTVITALFSKHNEIPTEKMIRSVLLKKGMEDGLVNVITKEIFNKDKLTSLDREHILGEVETFAKRKKMKDAIYDSVALLQDNNFDEINNVIQDALKFNLDTDLGYDLYDVDARYQAMADQHQEQVSTGYKKLDAILHGGWSKKELHCVMGPPGIGKSIFLCNWGYHALINGYNVVHYSFEMSEERVSMRYDAISSQVAQSKLKENREKIKEIYEKIRSLSKAHLRIKEFPTGGASVTDITAHLEQLKTLENFEPDLIVVDYGDIMKSTRKTFSAYEEQGWIFRELRGLAIRRNVAVITGTQAKRDALNSEGGTKESIGMDQVADSMEKNRILDVLFSIVQRVRLNTVEEK